jgi:hypothetical protein
MGAAGGSLVAAALDVVEVGVGAVFGTRCSDEHAPTFNANTATRSAGCRTSAMRIEVVQRVDMNLQFRRSGKTPAPQARGQPAVL